MKNVAIVCEYNPFHLGHKHQIDTLRVEGAECIICVMSGNFTQRGEPAIVEKYTRAHAALACGADLVLELPFPYSSLSAEGFARAGAYIADCVGADTLSFGSECGDISVLSRAADIVSSPEFCELYTSLQRSTNSSTSAYFQAYRELSSKEGEFLSNDILGISYIRAINELSLLLAPTTLKRMGSCYSSEDISAPMPSAMAIRHALYDIGLDAARSALPIECADILNDAVYHGEMCDTEKFFHAIHSFFRLNSPEEIRSRAVSLCGGNSILDDGDGLVERICTCAQRSTSQKEFYDALFNSRYTNSRIRRVILYCLFGVSDVFRHGLPRYTQLLGANEIGRNYLSSIRKNAKIQIVTKPSDVPDSVDLSLSRRADSFYGLISQKTHDGGYFVKKSPVIV